MKSTLIFILSIVLAKKRRPTDDFIALNEENRRFVKEIERRNYELS